ncbi:DHA2 family efflux MFS transporter permease subunit [Paraburkholderia sabiae]|uniref:DHA2 family efflux MFS transporter permease subunit n=1 Tax=Paraburkholderia sabiae TaxID=273251 RepID=A0ABU9QEP7_9BURK|nr:DHA2 family efflux MFS transporter permease subunit [Paraburkholderia sabiae]WJZ76838.1 DHA2 family efflux MFS transporter permease subunit [Paraburkholderia sabiae]CAD6546950.1 putative transport protein HsrA [Paraburkholderia sabiae]CAG9231687.1 Drug resistance transporter, EmrB/QacA subfamily [Paraburkholderia sabiae]
MKDSSRSGSLGPLPYVVAATFFMEYLDTTIIATALPQMAQSFGTSPNALSLGMSAYMIALAIFIPASGWVADRFGSRSVFFSAIVTFTLASLLCGVSQNVVEFTAARVLQGIGGALMVPVGRLTVVRSIDKKQLMQAISTITWPGIVAPVVGPPIGGFITTYASWRWIFLLNLPVCLVVLIAVLKWVPNLRSAERRPFDALGLVLSAMTLTAILYGADMASQPDTNPFVGLGVVVIGLAIGCVAFYQARRQRHPLIDVSTLKIPTFSVTVVTGTITRIGIGAVPYLMPLLFQIGFGLSAFKSGLLLLVSATGNLGMKALTTRILTRYGFRRVAIAASTICGMFTIVCGMLTPDSPLAWILLVVFVYGLGRSLQFSTLATLAYADVPSEQTSAANTLWNAAAQMSIGLGIAFGAVALRAASAVNGNGNANGNGGDHAHVFTLGDFRFAFLCAGVVTIASVYGYVKLARDAGNRLRAASN